MIVNDSYNRLVKSEPMGFIDPFQDLGEFDLYQMTFTQPVRTLRNKYSGQPYSKAWQDKIEEMRKLYIDYQISLRESDKQESFQLRARKQDTKDHIEDIVSTYLRLGFRFSEIEKRMSLTSKYLRKKWCRSKYISSSPIEFYRKKDLEDGYYLKLTRLSVTMLQTGGNIE